MHRPFDLTEIAPAAYEVRDGCGEPYEEPRGELEHALANAWSDALRVEKVGRNDNFFALGGNSLLGMDLTEMLASRLSIQVPVVMLFQYPTIRELAEVISVIE